jgi:hypothetical protein
VRRERSRPLVIALETWLRQPSKTATAIHYSLKRWTHFTRFLANLPTSAIGTPRTAAHSGGSMGAVCLFAAAPRVDGAGQ